MTIEGQFAPFQRLEFEDIDRRFPGGGGVTPPSPGDAWLWQGTDHILWDHTDKMLISDAAAVPPPTGVISFVVAPGVYLTATGTRQYIVAPGVFVVDNGAPAAVWAGPTTNLTHRWPMDDANVSGATITDVVGGLNGTSHNGVLSAAGPVTQARSFDGAGAYIDLPTPAFAVDVGGPHDWTIGVWSYYEGTTPPTETNGALPRLFNFTGVGAASALSICVDDDLAGGNQFQHCNTTGGLEVSTLADTVPDATWTHIAMTYAAGAGAIKAYINGVLVSTTGVSGRLAETANMIGCREGVTLTGMYPGRLYQLVTYDRELTGAEIAALVAAN